MNAANWTMKLVATTILGVALVTGASAVTDTIFKYTTPKAAFYSISPMDMAPDGDSAAGDFYISWGGGLTSATGCFNTGIHLPQGAKINNMKVSYQSNASSEIYATLLAKALSTDSTTQLGTVDIADDTNIRKVANIPISGEPIVNNNVNVYGLGVCSVTGTTFYGALIGYTYTNAGD